MPKLRWIILPIAAMGMLAGVLELLSFERAETPRGYIDGAGRDLQTSDIEIEITLRRLTRAIDQADSEGDQATVIDGLRQRAEVYLRGANFLQATEDFDTLLELVPDDASYLFEAGRTALRDKRYDEALGRFRRLIEVHPEHAEAWVELGNSHRRLADEVLARLTRHLDSSLAGEPVKEALRLAELICALPDESPRRKGAAQRFDALLPDPDDRAAAQEFLDLAFEHLTESRRSYLQSLELTADTNAIAGLQKLLARAQLAEEAGDLGWFAFRMPGMRMQPRFLLETVAALDRLGNIGAANRLAHEAVTKRNYTISTYELDPGEIPLVCAIYYRLKAWEPLLAVSENLGALVKWLDLPYPNTVAFYSGMANLGLEDPGAGLTALASVTPSSEPFEGAFIESLFVRLDAAREENDVNYEKELMASIVFHLGSITPDDPRAGRVGPIWLRRGELFLEENLVREAEASLVQALSLLPGRCEEIFPLWEEAGREACKTRGRTIESMQDAFTITPAYVPEQGYGSFEYCAAAQRFLENQKHILGIHALSRIEVVAPGIPALLELNAELTVGMGLYREAAESLLRLGEIIGPNERLIARIEALPAEAFADKELELRRIVLDANHIMLPAVVREMAASGATDQARATLAAHHGEERTELRLLKAELYGEQEQWPACRIVFEGAPDDEVILRAPGLALMAGTWGGGGTDTFLTRVVTALLSRRPPIDPKLMAGVDALFSEKRTDHAAQVLEQLDKYPEHRDAELLLRLGVAQTIQVKKQAASDTFARAEAFLETPEPALGRLILAADHRDWEALSDAAYRLAEAGFGSTPYRHALLRGLQGDPALAIDLLGRIELAPEREPHRRLAIEACRMLLESEEDAAQDVDLTDPLVQFFRLPDRRTPPPQIVLALLAALELDPFPAWTLARLGDLPPELSINTWTIYLVAGAAQSLGNPSIAERFFNILSAQRGFAPAWIARGQILAERLGEDSPQYLAFLSQRVAALGAEALSTHDIVLFQVRTLLQRGDGLEALALLERALEAEPNDTTFTSTHTRLLVEVGDRLGALNEYHTRLDAADDEERGLLVPEVLALLDDMQTRSELSAVGWWSEVEALEAQMPLDPMIVRALVQRAVDSGDPRVTANAWSRAHRFRERIDDTSLESLRPGATAQWFELFRTRDAARAAELVYGELETHPASLDLWRLWAEALDTRGDTQAAWDAVARMLPIFPDPALWRQGAWLMARLAQDPFAVQAAATRASQLSPEHSAELAFLPQLAEYRRGGNLSRARLEQSWEERDSFEDPRAVLLLARCYALSLLRLGSDENRRLAHQVLTTALEYAPDSLSRDITRAYLAMSKARG